MRGGYDLVVRLLALSPLVIEPAFAARRSQQQDVLLPPIPIVESPPPREHVFTLRHIYHKGSHQYPDLHRKVDIHPETTLQNLQQDDDYTTTTATDEFRVHSSPMTIQRLADRRRHTIDRLLEAGKMRGEAVSLPASAWSMDSISGPNITDKKTIVSFAHMAANAYELEPHKGDWVDVGGGFNYTEDFGWETDGLRGHIFADTENKTIVIGLKGTSMAVFDGAETTGHDKLNDNLFASCCCAQGGYYLWKHVCDCQTSAYTCNSTCLVKNLREKSNYYNAAQELYHNVTELYPNAEIWLTGHSLGGVVTSLLGLTFGLPVVTYEAFPDALAASRLGLPTPPGYHIGSHQRRSHTGSYHFGHTADPIFMGTCNSGSSLCTLAGYALQSKCHTANTCAYDTVKDLGWRVAIGTHSIRSVIRDVLEKYDTAAECEQEVDCVDCYEWKFFESNGTETTTSSSSTATSTTRSRTETCKTPGWWGCLDESTSAPSATVTTTQTITTTTCLTPGWFGCKDSTTTIETTTITTPVAVPAPTITTTSARASKSASSSAPATAPASTPTSTSSSASVTVSTSDSTSAPTSASTSGTSSSTTCATPGWFGCKDDPTNTPTSSSATPTSTINACTSKDWFGFICVDPSATQSSPTPTPHKKKCLRRNYTGRCKEWSHEEYEGKVDL